MNPISSISFTKKWNPDQFEFVPHQVHEQEYQRTLEELADIIYSTFKPVQKSPESTAEGSNNEQESASERTKSA